MDWLLIGAALLFAGIWLYAVTLHATTELLRALRERVCTVPRERMSHELDAHIDEGKSS
jgi:hypothetical protein